MSSSFRRIAASRANGSKSRGPLTPEGNTPSSRNALRHSLLVRTCVLESESRECFEDLQQQFYRRFQPVDEVEASLVEEMIVACWRLRRCWAHETRSIDNEIAAQLEGDQLDRLAAGIDQAVAGHNLPLMQRYETRLQMMYSRALNAFLFVRAATDVPDEHDPDTPAFSALAAGLLIAATPDRRPFPAPATKLPNEPNPISGHARPAPTVSSVAAGLLIPATPNRRPFPAPATKLPNEPNPVSEHAQPAPTVSPVAAGLLIPATPDDHPVAVGAPGSTPSPAPAPPGERPEAPEPLAPNC